MSRDRSKTIIAPLYGYKLLRIAIPVHNAARLLGKIMRLLTEPETKSVLPMSLARAGIITNQDLEEYLDYGFMGLYNGLTAEGIHKRKKLKKSQNILDYMGNAELAANLFRSTQAEEKLRRDNIQGKETANQVHYQAGVIVRRAIEELGGTMPENLPAVESIKKLERSEKKRLTAKNQKDTDE